MVIGHKKNIHQLWKKLNLGWYMHNAGMSFLCFQLEKNVEHIQTLIGLNNKPEYFVHIGTYIFGPQSETTGFVVKDGPKCIAKFSPIGQFIVVLRHPLILHWRIILLMTRECHKIFNHTILNHPMVGVCVLKIGELVVQQLSMS